MNRLFWLNDRQWGMIAPLLPPCRGAKRVDDRRVLSGIIHVLRTGMPWRDCPADYGPYTTVYNRFNRWSGKGIWQALYATLTGDHRPPREIMVDSSHVKAHRAAAGAQKGGRGCRPSADLVAGERLRSML